MSGKPGNATCLDSISESNYEIKSRLVFVLLF